MLIIDILIFLTSFPIGFLIAWLAKDELKFGKKYFFILALISAICVFVSLFFMEFYLFWSFGFIGVVSLISFLMNVYLHSRIV